MVQWVGELESAAVAAVERRAADNGGGRASRDLGRALEAVRERTRAQHARAATWARRCFGALLERLAKREVATAGRLGSGEATPGGGGGGSASYSDLRVAASAISIVIQPQLERVLLSPPTAAAAAVRPPPPPAPDTVRNAGARRAGGRPLICSPLSGVVRRQACRAVRPRPARSWPTHSRPPSSP